MGVLVGRGLLPQTTAQIMAAVAVLVSAVGVVGNNAWFA